MIIKDVDYKDGEHILEATTVEAIEGKKLPTIVLVHAWRGKDSFVKEKAKELASWGYHAVAIDVYGKGVLATNDDESAKLMSPFAEDRGKLKQRLLSGIDFVKKLSFVDVNNIMVIGFCFGGLCAIDIARSGSHVKGVASFHGILKKPEIDTAKEITTKLLIMHGDLDTMVSREDVVAFEEEMSEKKADWQLIVFSNTYHAFTNPVANNVKNGTVYNPLSCVRSFNYLKMFARELFS